MGRKIKWTEHFKFDPQANTKILNDLGLEKVYAMALMPVRGKKGFRKLDYEYAKKIQVNEILQKIVQAHFNVLGLVIKDTDGACLWDTHAGWNPTERDILGEFCDAAEDFGIKIIVSFTSMNDAYQGSIHPDRVSVHGKGGEKFGRKYERGDISTHPEGEMRIDLPKKSSFQQYQKKIPFLTKKMDIKQGKSRDSRGRGYIPETSFMCPNSNHIDYLLDLAKEIVKKYPISAFFADYIRYDDNFTDLCTCERCTAKFREKYGSKPKLLRSSEWYDFKADTISSYGKRLHSIIKKADPSCLTGWFCLPGPKKWYTRKRLGQDWATLSEIFDISCPMEYPYLMGTRDDGWFWGKVGDFFHWYYKRNMKKRAREFKGPVLSITNSVECNKSEMLKQMRTFNFGMGIALFKYFGTKQSQWKALKQYGKEELNLSN
ncbi:MAG: hypothetical protein BAJALOKI2v1_570013 [Promethearchaeota archaeon]|nr:MAG: hypothetical protein BAJALOKI2v1_570013 [Candidatus Lokiarchaeota archaeon]